MDCSNSEAQGVDAGKSQPDAFSLKYRLHCDSAPQVDSVSTFRGL